MLGSRVEQLHHTAESARNLIRLLLYRDPHELLLQIEVVKEGRAFENTTIGNAVNRAAAVKSYECMSGIRKDCEGFITSNTFQPNETSKPRTTPHVEAQSNLTAHLWGFVNMAITILMQLLMFSGRRR